MMTFFDFYSFDCSAHARAFVSLGRGARHGPGNVPVSPCAEQES